MYLNKDITSDHGNNFILKLLLKKNTLLSYSQYISLIFEHINRGNVKLEPEKKKRNVSLDNTISHCSLPRVAFPGKTNTNNSSCKLPRSSYQVL